MADTFKYVQAQPFTLAGAGASIGDSTVLLTSFKDIDGSDLAMTDFGSVAFGTLEPGNGSQEEQISFTGVIQNANGTATLTGVKTALMKSPYTQTANLAKSHVGGSRFVISNTAGFYDKMTSKADDETVTGTWTFTSTATPRYDTHPTFTSNVELVDKQYVDDTAVSGAPDMNTITKGIAEEATVAEINADTQAGGTGAELAVNPFYLAGSKYGTQLPSSDQKNALAGTAGTPSATNKYVTADDVSATASASKIARADSNGKLNTWIDQLPNASLTAGETISGATLPAPVFIANANRNINTILQLPTSASSSVANSIALSISTTQWGSQTFNTGVNTRIQGVTIATSHSGATLTARLYAVDGSHKPTGSILASGTTTASGSLSRWNYISFGTAVTVTASTEYAIVILASGAEALYGTNDATTYCWWSNDSGSTWSNQTPLNLAITVYGWKEESFTNGRVYACDTSLINRAKFDGFATTTATAGNTITVQTSGVVPGFTGLTPGANYYVQDGGGIGTSVGTAETLVGVAVSATQIMIKKNLHEVLRTEVFRARVTGMAVEQFEIPIPTESISQLCNINFVQGANAIGGQIFLDNKITAGTLGVPLSTASNRWTCSKSGSLLSVYYTGTAVSGLGGDLNISFYKN